MHHANLENAEQLNTVNWSGAVITEETIFPSNFSVEDAKQNGAFFIPSPDKSLDNYPFTTNISNINLRGFNLTGANLSGFNLKYADMAYATLKNAKLENSNMAYSNLEDADLSCVNLKEVNLTGAYLGGANLSGADLSNQDKLKADDLYRVRYDEKTIFPFNNTPPPYAIKTALDKDCQKT